MHPPKPAASTGSCEVVNLLKAGASQLQALSLDASDVIRTLGPSAAHAQVKKLWPKLRSSFGHFSSSNVLRTTPSLLGSN